MIKQQENYKNILLNVSELFNKDHLKFKVRFMVISIISFFIILLDIYYLKFFHNIDIIEKVKKITNYSSLDYLSYTISSLIQVGYKDDYKYIRESILLFIKYNLLTLLFSFIITKFNKKYNFIFLFWVMCFSSLIIALLWFILNRDYNGIVYTKNMFLIYSYIYIAKQINSYLISIDDNDISFLRDYNSKIYFLISLYYVIFSFYENINNIYYIIYIINILNISLLTSLFFKELFLILLTTSINALAMNLFFNTTNDTNNVKMEGDYIVKITDYIIHAKAEASFAILLLFFILSARDRILKKNKIISIHSKALTVLILCNLSLFYFPFMNNSFVDTGHATFAFSIYLFVFFTCMKKDFEKLNITNYRYINHILIIISYLLLLSSLHFCDFFILNLFKIFTENSAIQILNMCFEKIILISSSFLCLRLFNKKYNSTLEKEKENME